MCIKASTLGGVDSLPGSICQRTVCLCHSYHVCTDGISSEANATVAAHIIISMSNSTFSIHYV